MPTGIPLPTCSDAAPTGSPPVCGTGFYGIGDNLPGQAHADPTSCHPYPMWFDCDFCRSGGNLVAAAVPNACDGNFGQLQVWQYDDEAQPNAAGHETLETTGVWAASLVPLDSGRVDLFYLRSAATQKVYRRRSEDGGRTWGAPVVYDFGFTAGLGTLEYPPSATSHGGARLGAAWSRESGLLLLAVNAQDPVDLSHSLWLIAAEATADGSDWSFYPKHAYPNLAGNLQLQALRDGGFVILPSVVKVDSLARDGTFQARYPRPGSQPLTLGTVACVSEAQGIVLSPWHFGQIFNPSLPWGWGGGSGYWTESVWSWIVSAAGATWSDWSDPKDSRTVYSTPTPPAVNPYTYYLSGWLTFDYPEYNPPGPISGLMRLDQFYRSHAGRIHLREDGVFEFLRPAADGTLQFARCRKIGADCSALWEGATGTP